MSRGPVHVRLAVFAGGVALAWLLATCSREDLDSLRRFAGFEVPGEDHLGEAPPGPPSAQHPPGKVLVAEEEPPQATGGGGEEPEPDRSGAVVEGELAGMLATFDLGEPVEIHFPRNPDSGRPETVYEFSRQPGGGDEILDGLVRKLIHSSRRRDFDGSYRILDEMEQGFPSEERVLRQVRAYTMFYEAQYRFHRLRDMSGTIDVCERLDALAPEFFDHLRLWGMASYLMGDGYSTVKHLEEYIRRGGSPDGLGAALAQVYHGQNEDNLAIKHLKDHLSRHPEDGKAVQLLARISSEQVVTEGYSDRESAHFRVEFDGTENLAAAYQLLNVMEMAYRDVGRALDYHPPGKTALILFSEGSYRQLAARGFAPDWSGGFWDGHKIRIPTEKATRIEPGTRDTLYHEFAHAVIHSRAGKGSKRIPHWLHEGLAQMVEPGNASYSWRSFRLPPDGVIPNIRTLESYGWGGGGTGSVSQFYRQSHSLVAFLRTTFPPRKLSDLVDAYAAGMETDAAFRSVYGLDSAEIHSRWRRGLN